MLLLLLQITDVRNVDSFEFTMELAKELIQPHLLRRKTIGLNQNVLANLEKAGVSTEKTKESQVYGYPPQGPGRRYHACLRDIRMSESKQAGEKKNSSSCNSKPTKKQRKDSLQKVKAQCQICGEAICKEHTYFLCHGCKM